MNFNLDISVGHLIISGSIIVGGWLLRGIGWALVEGMKKLVTTLIETMARVETLDTKLKELTNVIGEFQQMKIDIGQYFNRLRKLETKFDESSKTS